MHYPPHLRKLFRSITCLHSLDPHRVTDFMCLLCIDSQNFLRGLRPRTPVNIFAQYSLLNTDQKRKMVHLDAVITIFDIELFST